MLRLARLQNNEYSPEQLQQATEALQLLQKHLPASIVQLFATPSLVNTDPSSALDWLSTKTGQIQRYESLSDLEKEQISTLFTEKTAAIRSLQAHLQQTGQSSQAELLRPFTAAPNLNDLYAVDGQPVLINWLNPPAPASEAEPVAITPAAVPLATAPTSKRLWPWLLLLLLILLLLGALLWWWLSKKEPITTEPLATAIEQPQSVIEPISTPVAADPIPTSTSDLAPIASVPITVPAPASNNYACAANTKKPPEFTLIFDTSHSMSLNIGVSLQDEEWFYDTDIETIEQLDRAKRLLTGPSRFSVAQTALRGMVNDLHPDISARLLTFNACESIQNHGVFSPTQRQRLLSTINNLEPQAGTPSAEALFLAAQQMDGVNNDGVIVLFIDGEDGCGMNICQVAEYIAKEKPRLRANVVDISGFGLSNCVAEATGGRIYSSGNASRINELLRNSIEEVAADAAC